MREQYASLYIAIIPLQHPRYTEDHLFISNYLPNRALVDRLSTGNSIVPISDPLSYPIYIYMCIHIDFLVVSLL